MTRSPQKARSGWARLAEPDMVVALSAVLIGLCALGISLVQVRIMREEQHASVWPRLVVSQSYSQGSRLGILVGNPGIGPAVIRSVAATVDGEPQPDWVSLLNTLAGEDRPWSLSASFIRGRVVPAGAMITTIQVNDSGLADHIQAELDRVGLEVCYCSVYDRCWITRLHDAGDAPQEVAACPAPQPEPFEG